MLDSSQIITQVITSLWWLIPVAILIGFVRSAWFKGVTGEALIKLAAVFSLPRDTYHPFHNVTLRALDGTTQIDHIFVSRFGIFVVETKNMKGWIFGGEKQPQWTQKLFKKSFKFQNPLRQNYKHTKTLETILDVPADAIRSVVVFVGESTFKTPMPENVTQGSGCITYIKSFREPVLSEEQVRVAVAQIESGRLAPTRETHRNHIQQLYGTGKKRK